MSKKTDFHVAREQGELRIETEWKQMNSGFILWAPGKTVHFQVKLWHRCVYSFIYSVYSKWSLTNLLSLELLTPLPLGYKLNSLMWYSILHDYFPIHLPLLLSFLTTLNLVLLIFLTLHGSLSIECYWHLCHCYCCPFFNIYFSSFFLTNSSGKPTCWTFLQEIFPDASRLVWVLLLSAFWAHQVLISWLSLITIHWNNLFTPLAL